MIEPPFFQKVEEVGEKFLDGDERGIDENQIDFLLNLLPLSLDIPEVFSSSPQQALRSRSTAKFLKVSSMPFMDIFPP
jgi:hypothetical protein